MPVAFHYKKPFSRLYLQQMLVFRTEAHWGTGIRRVRTLLDTEPLLLLPLGASSRLGGGGKNLPCVSAGEYQNIIDHSITKQAFPVF
jgi:hypothetical protein